MWFSIRIANNAPVRGTLRYSSPKRLSLMKNTLRQFIETLLRRIATRQSSGRRYRRLAFDTLEDRTLPSGGFPYVESINRTTPTGPVTNANSLTYTVTFSEAVTGVGVGDFQLALSGTAAGTVIQVTPVNGSVYTVTASSLSGNGTLGLNLVDNGSIRDVAGDPLTLQNAAAAFQNPQSFGTGSEPYAVALADVNGDGIPDLVVANENSNTVSMLMGNGNGTFQAQLTFATGNEPCSVAIGDLHGNSIPDLVVANRTDGTLSVLLGNGNGTFQTQQTFTTGNYPTAVAVGDVNGDGNSDLVVAKEGSNSVSVLLGNGNGTFQAQQTFASGITPLSVKLGDVNGDGIPDIVLADEGSNTVSVILGNGNGTFQAQQTFATGNEPFSVALSDVNGDGKPDLVVANGSLLGTVSVLLSNGNGTFQTQQTFATGYSPRSVVVGDVNGDGIPDVVAANEGSNSLGVLLGNGNGTFQPQQTFSPGNFGPGNAPLSVAVGDLNGDGRPDLVVPISGSTQAQVSVFLNLTGSFAGQVYTLTTGLTTNLAFSGLPSTATAGNNLAFTLKALDPSNQAVVGYSGTVHFSTSDTGPGSFVPADYTFVPADAGVHVFTSGATLVRSGIKTITAYDTALPALSTTASVSVIPAAVTRFAVIAPAIVKIHTAFGFMVTAQDPFGNTITGYSGTADFTSSDSQALLPINTTLTSGVGSFSATLKTPGIQTLTAADSANAALTGTTGVNAVNSSGIAPFVQSINRTSPAGPATNANTVSFLVIFSEAVVGVNLSDFALGLTGTATGTLTHVTPVSGSVYSVTVTGIAGVGSVGLNLVDNGTIANLAGYPLTQQEPRPAAFAVNGSQTITTGKEPSSLVMGDVNGDGKPDIVVSNQLYHFGTASVLLGNGNGTFQAPQAFFAGSNPVAVAMADVNGDGKPDVVVVNLSSNTVSVLLGNGNGTFQAQQTSATGNRPFSVAIGDVTGDGNADLVVANRDSNTVSVLLGNGNGTFQAQQTFATGTNPDSVAIGNLTGDGKADLVVANYGSNTVGVFLGNGNGTFQAQQTFATGSQPDAVAVGDVTGSGKADLVVANKSGLVVSVLLGNGNGTFQAQQTFATGSEPYSVAVGDVTGDGKADLVVADSGGNAVSLLLGNGNGTFQTPLTFATGSDPISAAIGDLTGDGKADLVVANEFSNTVSVLLGNGNGTFQARNYSPHVLGQIQWQLPMWPATETSTSSSPITPATL